MHQPQSIGKKPPGLMRNAAWNAMATVCNIILSFLVAPLTIRYLGTDQYGLLLLVWSVAGVLGIVNLGMTEATLRYVAHYHADGDMRGINRVFGSTLSFYVFVSVIVSIVVFAATPIMVNWIKIPVEEHALAVQLLHFSALLFSLSVISGAFQSIPMALQRYDISSKIALGQNVVQSAGIVALLIFGFDLLDLVLWQVLAGLVGLCVHIGVACWILPGLSWLPRVSLSGLREIFGYGVFSSLSNLFLKMYRESGKLILGNQVGPTGVAYLGTPDSVAYRLHMVLISGIETLLPKFSANRDSRIALALVSKATWIALASAIILFIPLATLMPDFLSLWINPDFAHHAAVVGQLIAISFIGPAGFDPIATFFRGTGKPGFVTPVIAVAAVVVVIASVILVPKYGPEGVGYGYLISSVTWLVGLLCGWWYLFGTASLRPLIRTVITPLLIAAFTFIIQCKIRSYFGDVTWLGLFVLGGLFAGLSALLLIAVDLSFGGDCPSRQLLQRLAESEKIALFRRYITVIRSR